MLYFDFEGPFSLFKKIAALTVFYPLQLYLY